MPQPPSPNGQPIVSVAIHAALDPRAAGGVQTNLTSLVQGLANESQLQVRLLAPQSVTEPWRSMAPPAFQIQQWPHIFPWYREGNEPRLAARVTEAVTLSKARNLWLRDRALAAHGTQVLHFPYQLAFDTRLPSVYEPWDLQHIHLPHLFSQGECAWRTAMYSRACRRAAIVVTATATTKRDVVKTFDIDPRKVAVIYRDSSLKPAAADTDAERETLAKFAIDGPFAFFPSMTYPHKNHLSLLRALSSLRKNGTTIQLICSGRTVASHQPKIETLIEELGIRDQIRFVGSLEERELVALYRTARLLVFPSLFEGLGLPLLEAMQFGLPIAAANVSCIPEVVGNAALLFDPLDPENMAGVMSQIWDNEALRNQLAARGRDRRRSFDWSLAAPMFAAVYRKAAGAPEPEEAHLLTRAFSC